MHILGNSHTNALPVPANAFEWSPEKRQRKRSGKMSKNNANLVPRRLANTLTCKQGAVRAVRYNVDGNYCMTCGGDKTVKLWNPERGLVLRTYMGHGGEVLDACSSSDNGLIASGGMDKQVFLWDVGTGKITRKLRGHAANVNAVAFNEESTVVFSASLDGSVKCWDMKSNARDPIQTLDEATDSVLSIAVSDHEILTGSADNRVRRYDMRQGQMYADFVGKSATSVNFSRDGQCLLVSSLDSTIRLLDKDNGELLADFTGHKNIEYKIDSCLLSTDAQIISGSEDGKVYCWDLIESRLIEAIEPPTASAFSRGLATHSLSAHPTVQSFMVAAGANVYLYKLDDSEDA